MINLSTLSHEQLVFLIQIYLGLQQKNIHQISYCLSRVRIQLQNIQDIASNEYFLALNAQGVIRDTQSIHIIYGKQSPRIASQLISLYQSIEQEEYITLISLCQYQQNIQHIAISNNIPIITLKDIPSNINTLLSDFNNTYSSSSISLKDNQLLIHHIPNIENFMIIYTNIITYWALIQSSSIFDFINISSISSISRENFSLNIHTTHPIKIPSTREKYQLKIVTNSVEQNTIVIQECSDLFFDIFNIHYEFLKKQCSTIDNNTI